MDDNNHNKTKEELFATLKTSEVEVLPSELDDSKVDWASILREHQGILISQCFPEHKYKLVKLMQEQG